MKTLLAFIKKEIVDNIRNGKILILVILFLFIGIQNPAIAKLTPWILNLLSDSFSEMGITIGEMQIDALTSWTQFYKNIPLGLVAFLLIFSNIFTKEYQSGTLILVLTKGLARHKVVLAKTILMLLSWTVCYWLCYLITYGYNAFFWDNSIVSNISLPATMWYLFGLWVISLLILFSTLLSNNSGVLLGIGTTVLLAYLVNLIPKAKYFSPIALTNAASLMMVMGETVTYTKTVIVVLFLSCVCVVAGIMFMNRKQL